MEQVHPREEEEGTKGKEGFTWVGDINGSLSKRSLYKDTTTPIGTGAR